MKNKDGQDLPVIGAEELNEILSRFCYYLVDISPRSVANAIIDREHEEADGIIADIDELQRWLVACRDKLVAEKIGPYKWGSDVYFQDIKVEEK